MTMLGPAGETRIAPLLPAHAMKTYELRQPLATHYRRATCREVDCERYRLGFSLTFDLTNPEHVRAANLVRNKSGRAFTVERINTSVTLRFPAGQDCFNRHHVPLERDPLMIVRGGDWRGNPRRERFAHTSAESFVDDWATSLDRLDTEKEKG